jgi:two-component system, chemotaxis family, CheB/CheR fusion protein
VKLDELLHFLAEERNFDLRGYKPTTLERRIRKRMGQLSLPDYESYVEHIRAKPSETNQLLDTILINVTEFFRDPAAWEILASDILPHLLKRLRTGDSFRAWVAGCSTGEEVYSLAILVAEFFGSRLAEFDIKIYATDVDESALNIARRGEYSTERLRRIRSEWREKYFSTAAQPRIHRDLRRMLIFGRSDLAQDAPISHVQMIVCRNVLIYFDSITQMRILSRLHYALDPGGILFLGKAESKLSYSTAFEAVDPRWRIFSKNHAADAKAITRWSPLRSGVLMGNNDRSSQDQELAKVKLYYGALLEVLEPGIFSLDANDVIINDNKSALELWGLSGSKLVGQHIGESALKGLCPELPQKIEESHRTADKAVRFDCTIKVRNETRTLAVSLRPVKGDSGQRVGTLIYSENVSHRQRLQTTIEQLEATGEELQSSNEELETTNEELQSTNEELETTNEELQSTTRELDSLNSRYAETLERMPWAVAVLDHEGRVQFWNSAAQRLFDMEARSVIGLELSQLPIQPALRDALVRRRKAMDESNTPMLLRNQELKIKRSTSMFDVHLTPLRHDGGRPSLLLMFAPQPPENGKNSTRNSRAGNSSGARRKTTAAVRSSNKTAAGRKDSAKRRK